MQLMTVSNHLIHMENKTIQLLKNNIQKRMKFLIKSIIIDTLEAQTRYFMRSL